MQLQLQRIVHGLWICSLEMLIFLSWKYYMNLMHSGTESTPATQPHPILTHYLYNQTELLIILISDFNLTWYHIRISQQILNTLFLHSRNWLVVLTELYIKSTLCMKTLIYLIFCIGMLSRNLLKSQYFIIFDPCMLTSTRYFFMFVHETFCFIVNWKK